MEFYGDNEIAAVRMIADRVRETDEYEYEGWSPEEILDPTRKSYIFDSSLSFLKPIYCRKGAIKINDLDRSLGFRKRLKNYPPFIHIEGYESDASSRAETGWIKMIENAAKSLHISAQRGFGWQNQYSNCERVLKPISLLKLQDQRSSLTAEIIDSDQVHGKSNHTIAKILFIQNEGRIAPYKTRAFVRSVRELLIDKCGYDFVYGHSANCDQLDHQHNSLGTDKRFDNHHNFSLTIDSKQHAFAVSNLCHFWNLMGFMVTPSPENENDLAVSLMSAEYKKFLLNLAPKLWGQVFDYSKSAKQK